MARPLRLEHEGAAWHITARGNERRNIFRSEADRRIFLVLLAVAVKRFRWSLRSWVLMSNHYHLVLVTPVCTLSRGMHWLGSAYAQYFNRKYKRVGHLFQGRFKAILVDRQDYLNEVLRYTILNPVRAHMVERPEQYRWSSYRALAGLEPTPEWLDTEWLFELDDDPDKARAIYRDYVSEKLAMTDSIWDTLVGQIYLGSASWIESMRALVESRPRSDEHSQAQRLIPRLTMTRVTRSVAAACEIDPDTLRHTRGGAARMLAAWIGWNQGLLRLREIAASLRLRSSGYISTLVKRCETELARDKLLQRLADKALAGLRTAPA